MQRKLGIVLRFALGAVFIFSAYTKIRSTGLFEIILIDQGLTADRITAAYLTRLLISLELFLGISFFQPYLIKKLIAPLTLATLGGFSIYLIYLMFAKEVVQHCGCFGDFIRISPRASLMKNLALMAMVWYLIQFSGSAKSKKAGEWLIPVIVGVMSLAFVFVVSPVRSLEGNPFARYTHFQPVGAVDLNRGEYLIAVFSLDCPHCQQTAKALGQLEKGMDHLPQIYCLFWQEDTTTVKTFFRLTGTEYPYHEISADEFFNLIGEAPPRLYRIRDGKIVEYWDENIIGNVRRVYGVRQRF
ncbi:MAG: MauE/DoxX family redox-associated membrane protein [Calditrichia bacterium]